MSSDALRAALGALVDRAPESGIVYELAALITDVAPVLAAAIEGQQYVQVTLPFAAGRCGELRVNHTVHRRRPPAA